jgi:hypothetical protein
MVAACSEYVPSLLSNACHAGVYSTGVRDTRRGKDRLSVRMRCSSGKLLSRGSRFIYSTAVDEIRIAVSEGKQ